MGGQARRTATYDSHASIALVGLQGAGKRSLGFIAASHFRRRLVLECVHFEKSTGLSKASYMRTYGRQAFYSQTLELLQSMLMQYTEGCIIVCGVASLVPGASKIISEFARSHPVIEIRRDHEKILKENRIPEADRLHRLCSNFEFFNLDDPDDTTSPELAPTPSTLKKVKENLEAFLDFIIPNPALEVSDPFSLQAISLERRSRSCVTSLRLSDFLSENAQIQHENVGEDAVELVIDCWNEDVRQSLSKCVSMLRRAVTRPLLVSFELDDETYLQALSHGVRVGVDYLVLDTNLADETQIHLLNNRGSTKLIAHYHYENPGKGGWLGPERIEACKMAQDLGCNAIRLTQQARRQQDNHDVRCFLQRLTASENLSIPVSAYNLGLLGKASRIANPILSPVSHIPTDTSDGDTTSNDEITVRDIVQARFACYEYDALKFWILGTHAAAPCMPKTNKSAYEFYGMQHSFDSYDSSSLEVFLVARDPYFGGAALTTTFKELAFDICASTSPHASAIGAVSTILPLRELDHGESESLAEQALQRNMSGPITGLYGDNTDWAGIYISIKRRLSPRNAATIEQSVGLVLGAGSSARAAVYTLMRLRMHTICICNRTHGHAVKLARHFGQWGSRNGYQSQFQVVDLARSSWPGNLNHPTVVVSCVPSGTMPLPDETFDHPCGGVLVDLCCSPSNTPLREQVKQVRRSRQIAWEAIKGLDVLLETTILQFEQMTGYIAPRAVMERAIQVMNAETPD